ncbi:hypothetical protein LshimejAT787_0905550 [Lyophyllum shimeji]|uniref:Uncharacterized protein n=1 Tax=Lyophyllum shimeji TaxID=47721 RepID=A0A9P3PRE8_LYOSH|nr:hypothetical protein LshimejAT787_0905550 [Lyophyllum shimeji]
MARVAQLSAAFNATTQPPNFYQAPRAGKFTADSLHTRQAFVSPSPLWLPLNTSPEEEVAFTHNLDGPAAPAALKAPAPVAYTTQQMMGRYLASLLFLVLTGTVGWRRRASLFREQGSRQREERDRSRHSRHDDNASIMYDGRRVD